MKKIISIFGLASAIVLLSGCSSNPVAKPTPVPIAKPAVEQAPTVAPETTPINNSATTLDNSKAALPSDVSTQPAAAPADEVKNIDKDLKAMDASNGQDSISNKDLGL